MPDDTDNDVWLHYTVGTGYIGLGLLALGIGVPVGVHEESPIAIVATAIVGLLFAARGTEWFREGSAKRTHLRGLRHNLCLGCAYPLKELPEPRCPECGREFETGSLEGNIA